MKMERFYKNSGLILLFHLWIVFPIKAAETTEVSNKITHQILMEVNENWKNLGNEIAFSFQPKNEQELIQLHLFNVIAYLKKQEVSQLDKKQRENRLTHLVVLQKYAAAGRFPINNLTDYRTPIFIDSHNTYCAVGYLLKESGFKNVAQKIASHQLLFYLKDIQHPELKPWQKASGFTMFELALIQPSYSPPQEVYAQKSPIEWQSIETGNNQLKTIVKNEQEQAIYGIFIKNEASVIHKIKKYIPKNQQWTNVGNTINGEVLEIVFNNNGIYLNAFLPMEKNPHQILKLKGNEWKKVAHFNGNIIAIQSFKKQIYVLGNFSKVNDLASTDFVVIDGDSIKPFKQQVKFKSVNHIPKMDKIEASESSLFLLSRETIFQFKNDSLVPLNFIPYFRYLNDLTLSATADSLIISSAHYQGFMQAYNKQIKSVNIRNIMHGSTTEFGKLKFNKAKLIDQKIIISGDFKISTIKSRINQNIRVIKCEDTQSKHWFGEGLMYHTNHTFYPILDAGIVSNFFDLNNKLYILKEDGSLLYADLNHIKKEVNKLKKRQIVEKQ